MPCLSFTRAMQFLLISCTSMWPICRAAIARAADLNERNANGDTPLLFIAREGHYKYPPNEVPQVS